MDLKSLIQIFKTIYLKNLMLDFDQILRRSWLSKKSILLFYKKVSPIDPSLFFGLTPYFDKRKKGWNLAQFQKFAKNILKQKKVFYICNFFFFCSNPPRGPQQPLDCVAIKIIIFWVGNMFFSV